VRGRYGGARRTAAVAVVGLLLGLLPAHLAFADSTTPTAGQVSTARAKASALAQRVGVMQAQLAAAQARLQTLGQAVDAAGEAYDGAMYRLQQAAAAAAVAQRAARGAQATLDAARLDVGRMAAAAYMGDGMGLGLGAIMSADSPDSVVEAVSTLGVLSGRQNAVLDRANAARVVAGVLNGQASDALAAVTAAASAALAAQQVVEQKVRAQSSQLGAINAQVQQLTTALAAARAHSSQLTLARQAGLARAAAQRAAARRAALLAAGHGGTGGRSVGRGGLPSASPSAARAIAYAMAQLGKPYEWGASGPDSFDCSGLTMMAWQAGGVSLPHWSVAQWTLSTPVPASQARPGDLVFFAYNLSDYTTIHHVALYLGGGQMIEAPFTGAVVRISSVDRPDLWGFARP
jgi:peptidoglycan DL-endopeptidase CwlO